MSTDRGNSGPHLRWVSDAGERCETTWEAGSAYWLDADPPGALHGDVYEGTEPVDVIVVQLKGVGEGRVPAASEPGFTAAPFPGSRGPLRPTWPRPKLESPDRQALGPGFLTAAKRIASAPGHAPSTSHQIEVGTNEKALRPIPRHPGLLEHGSL